MPHSRLFLATCALLWATVASTAAEPNQASIRLQDDQAEFLLGDEVVARYNFAPTVAKPYLWPLNGPGGVPLTRAWPMKTGAPDQTTDHVHQKSAWFCHGDVIPEGITLQDKIKGVDGVDFWAEGKGHGRIVNKQALLDQKQKNRLLTKTEWQTADGKKVLEETRSITLQPIDRQTWLFVFDIDLQATAAPITFGDTKEGSFGIRINDSIREATGKGKLENADGKVGEKNLWGRISNWCDYSGTIEGKKVGLAILADPRNPAPTAWHSRGYGLMAANPFGRQRSGFPDMKGKTDLLKLNKGDHLSLRYAILVHPGDAQEGKVAQHYAEFCKLPR